MAMRGYGRDEYEDLDEYEEEYEDQDDAAEDEYEEEETRQPTEQELEYLELRQRLKESIRKQMKKDSGSSHNSHEKRSKLPYDNYGSFFGPSQPVIAQRVIEESKSLLENPHLAERVSKPKHSGNKVHTSAPQGSRPQVNGHPLKVTNALKTQTKVQILKNTRDYSFLLSDDAELPAQKKDPPPQNMAVARPEARLAQLPQRSKLPINNVKKVINSRNERRAVPAARQIQSKARPQKSTSIGKPATSVDYQKQHSSNSGSGHFHLQASTNLPSKIPMISKERKIIPPSAKSSIPVVRKQSPSKPHSTIPKQTMDRRKQLQESSKGKLPSRQPMSSNPQARQPRAKVPSRPSSHQERPKKRPARQYSDDEDEDGGEAISMIRKMFGYNPKRYADDDDISDMEANFDQIQREELYSGRIGRKEDEEELLKIEEEERRERMRKGKKRKLSR